MFLGWWLFCLLITFSNLSWPPSSFCSIIVQLWLNLLVFVYSLFLCFSPFLIKIIDFSHFCLRCPRCPIRQLRRPKSSCRYPEIIILSPQRGQTLKFWGKFRERGAVIKEQRWDRGTTNKMSQENDFLNCLFHWSTSGQINIFLIECAWILKKLRFDQSNKQFRKSLFLGTPCRLRQSAKGVLMRGIGRGCTIEAH